MRILSMGDPVDLRFDYGFDAVVGRLLLMYYPDPVNGQSAGFHAWSSPLG